MFNTTDGIYTRHIINFGLIPNSTKFIEKVIPEDFLTDLANIQNNQEDLFRITEWYRLRDQQTRDKILGKGPGPHRNGRYRKPETFRTA